MSGRSLERHLARRLARRRRAERRFRLYGAAAIACALGVLLLLLGSIALRALPAFVQHEVVLRVALDAERLDPEGTRSPEVLARAGYAAPLREALYAHFPEVEGRSARRELRALLSRGAAHRLREKVLRHPALVGQRIRFAALLSDEADLYLKGRIDPALPERRRPLGDAQIAWLDGLREQGLVQKSFAGHFFTSGDSREPELAGIGGALVGSLLALTVTLALAFPLGVGAAIYLEEFARRGRLHALVEVNVNNLAAVPSIVFGLLGLAVFLGVFGLPRSAPLVGGMVLALMTLPTVVIASRSALAAVPPSVREAALAVGASPLQTVLHHVLPQALPGILTGTILGMAQALGETAPLLMIGMVAFVVDVPGGFTEAATALPVQIFLWADSPERAFVAKTSAAILVLLAFLVAMNLGAVLLRRRFERRLRAG